MKKIVLTVSAVILVTGAAFAAGSDHYGANIADKPASAVDTTVTTSIEKSHALEQKPRIQGADHNLFGNH